MSELIDNRVQRVRTLKGIIKRLHAGEAPDEVRSSLKELVCHTIIRKSWPWSRKSSRTLVERILSDFREGRQNVAEFWIQFLVRFVHIRYFAVKSEDGRYLGTLEVTQDVGQIRGLDGERRLLEYDQPAPAGVQ